MPQPKRFPLFNGETYDLSEHPHPNGPFSDNFLRTSFRDGSNPWWLTLDSDNGSQSFTGLSSTSGTGGTQLNTGTTTVGDVTTLQTPAVNWNDFDQLWFWAILSISDNSTEKFQVTYGNNRWADSVTEGATWVSSTSSQGTDHHLWSGGVDLVTSSYAGDRFNPRMWGLSISNNPDNATSAGHEILWWYDWEPFLRWDLNATNGQPAAGEYPFRVGIRTEDTAADRTLTIEEVAFDIL